MGPFLISFFIGIGIGTWIFTKLQAKAGNGNNSTAIVGALASGFGLFAVTYLTLRLIGF